MGRPDKPHKKPKAAAPAAVGDAGKVHKKPYNAGKPSKPVEKLTRCVCVLHIASFAPPIFFGKPSGSHCPN